MFSATNQPPLLVDPCGFTSFPRILLHEHEDEDDDEDDDDEQDDKEENVDDENAIDRPQLLADRPQAAASHNLFREFCFIKDDNVEVIDEEELYVSVPSVENYIT